MRRGRVAEPLVDVVDLPEIGVACAGSLFVVRYRLPHTAATLVELEAAHAARRKLAPGGIAMLNILDYGTPLPNDEMMRAAARSFRRIADGNACSATVVSGVGFWAAAARSALTALTMLARPACPSKVFSHVEPAIAWMEDVVPGEPWRWRDLVPELERWSSARAGAA